MFKIKRLFSTLLITFAAFNAYSESFFSGYTGGKLNYTANQESEKYDPELKLQAFFQGQFNFSENIWSHVEISVDTDDFISEELFHVTQSNFSIDEISLIVKAQIDASTNYFSAFMGTYDPIGSDIFLRRYFAVQPIASKITESWLGIAGSILYPHFGLGISDIIKLYKVPVAFGIYAYLNHEDKKYFVVNTDIRFACVFRYFSFDFAGGVGAPLSDRYEDEDVWFAVDKFYWHAGTTILIGNNYTQSLFIQAGLYNAPFTKSSKTIMATQKDFYLLLEPRIKLNTTHLNLSIYSFPSDTVAKLMYVNDTLGANLNIYTDAINFGKQTFAIGTHISYSLPEKYFLDLKAPLELIHGDFNVNVTPYISTTFLSGELHSQVTLRIMDFAKANWYKAFSFDLGYRTNF